VETKDKPKTSEPEVSQPSVQRPETKQPDRPLIRQKQCRLPGWRTDGRPGKE
jgi:hypothetical protein